MQLTHATFVAGGAPTSHILSASPLSCGRGVRGEGLRASTKPSPLIPLPKGGDRSSSPKVLLMQLTHATFVAGGAPTSHILSASPLPFGRGVRGEGLRASTKPSPLIPLPKGGDRSSSPKVLLMQLTDPALITGRRRTEQCIAPGSKPAIKDWSQLCERPYGKNRRQPLPARQHANYFDPGKVAFGPATICGARVHRFSHVLSSVWRRTLENFRIVIIKPLNTIIAIERLNSCTHPATQIALAVRVDFKFVILAHLFRRGLQPACASKTIVPGGSIIPSFAFRLPARLNYRLNPQSHPSSSLHDEPRDVCRQNT